MKRPKGPVDVFVTHDSYVDWTLPAQNFGNVTYIRSWGNHGYPYPFAEKRGLLRINADEIPFSPSAIELHAWVQQSIEGGSLKLYAVTGPAPEDWDEATVTWNNKPSQGTAVSASFYGGRFSPELEVIEITPVFDLSYGVYVIPTKYAKGTILSSEHADPAKRPFFRFIP